MNYSPNHPAVQAWQDKRKCDNCWGTDLPVVRKHNMCEECEPLTLRERTNLVNLRAGRPIRNTRLKSAFIGAFALWVYAMTMIDTYPLISLTLTGVAVAISIKAINIYAEERGW